MHFFANIRNQKFNTFYKKVCTSLLAYKQYA